MGGHQQHPLKPELVECVAREREMPDVGRVERPAEDADRWKIGGRPEPVGTQDGPVGINGLLNRGRARPLR
jgi:hypothetical protein